MEAGAYVRITVQSRPELNRLSWVYQGPDREGRLLVKCVGHGETTISVRRESVTPLALAPVGACMDPQRELSRLERFALTDDGTPLGVWMNLPGLGRNAIMIRTATVTGRDLVMYPRFEGYEVWFRSGWSQEEFIMLECDVLKECPRWHVWPWCSFCGRFLLPHEEHRRSRCHQKCRGYLRHNSASELATIRAKCMTNMLF